MSDTSTRTTDAEVRNAIVRRVEIGQNVRVDTILDDVSRDHGIADERVMDQLDRLERAGFVYLPDDADTTSEVRLP